MDENAEHSDKVMSEADGADISAEEAAEKAVSEQQPEAEPQPEAENPEANISEPETAAENCSEQTNEEPESAEPGASENDIGDKGEKSEEAASPENASQEETSPSLKEKKVKEKKPKEKKPPRKKPDFSAAARSALSSLKSFAAFARRSLKSAARRTRSDMKKILAALSDMLFFVGGSVLRLLDRFLVVAVLGGFFACKAVCGSLKRQLSMILPELFDLLYYIGNSAWRVLAFGTKTAARAVAHLFSAVFGAIFGWIAKKFKQPLYDIWCAFLTPFAKIYGGVADTGVRFKKAAKKGFLQVVGAVFVTLWRFLCGLCEFLRAIFNYAAPVVAVVFLVMLVRYYSTLQYAISVEYNGSSLGNIESEAAYNEAQSLIQDKVTFTQNDEPILSTPRFTVAVVGLDREEDQTVDDINMLSELMIEAGDIPVVYAYGLYINDELFGVYTADDKDTIVTALNNKLNAYNTPDVVDVHFEDDIMIYEQRFLQTVLTPPDAALELINGGTSIEAYYSVQKGDTISSICSRLGISREDFDSDNPELADGVSRGDIVTYHYIEPHLNVISTRYESYGQVIERTTEYVESSRYEEYCEILLQHGSDGYENVTAQITEVNGSEVGREIISRTVVEQMVPRKFRIGTKANTYLDGDTEIIDRLGTFCWPVGDEDCYVSSDFGYRSWDHSNHKAIDIAGIPRGTPIYAACDGKVTFSGTYGAYGKLVIVDCGGGYECYCGHCSELLVEVGDRVEKGDTIAEVGMTGSASGNHLHFEMRYHDDRINPFMALGGPGGHRFNFG